MSHAEPSPRRKKLEAEGVHFIGFREWLIKKLMSLALSIDPDIAIALFADIGNTHHDASM